MDDQLLTDVQAWADRQPKKENNYMWAKDASSGWPGKETN